MTFHDWWSSRGGADVPDGAYAAVATAWDAAVAAERKRCAAVAEAATTGLAGFVESDRMEFAVKNMAKLRATIAAAIRAGS